MKVCGIIAEYNPFHNGHKYQIEETRQQTGSTHIVAVMSGNFVQRGETALISKWARAEAAVKNGVDLVIELPVLWSTATAQKFALGGVSLLKALGCVDIISFGSECGDIDLLKKTALSLEREDVTQRLKENLDIGMSFASARAEALRSICGNMFYDVLENPNDILGIEYIKANDELEGEKLEDFCIARKGAAHDSIIRSENIASASDIRDMILNNGKWGRYVPENVTEIINRELQESKAPCLMSKLEFSIICCLRQLSSEDIALSPDISEGIENRIHNAALTATTLEALYSKAKTRRYSHSRIRRIVLNTFLGLKKEQCEGTPPYIKILAMNEKGKEILKQAKETATLPVITKSSDIQNLSDRCKEVYSLEDMTTDIYSLASPVIFSCGREKTTGIITVNAIPNK